MAGFNIVTNSTHQNDLNSWVHLVATYNVLTKQVLLYRNGVLLSTTSNIITAGLSGYVNATFSIGATTGANYFNGYIDDLRIYTGKVLTLDEINYISNKDSVRINPVIWYKFDDPNNLGLDTMGKANLGQRLAAPIPTYNNTAAIIGTGCINLTPGQFFYTTYNYSDIGNAFTISFWMKITTLNTNWDNVFYCVSKQSLFLISRNNLTTNFYIALFGSGTSASTSHYIGKFIADNIWNHYTITVEKTITNAVKINSYLNTVLNATTTSGTWDTSGMTDLGISSSQTALSMIGNLDDIQLYNKVLTQEQINNIYTNNSLYANSFGDGQNVITRLCTTTNDNTTESINFNSRQPIISVSRTNEPFYNSMKAYQSLNVPSNFLQKGYVEFEIEYPNSSYDITTAEFKNSNFSLVITDEDNKQVSDNNNIVDFKNLNINVPIKYY